MSAAAILGLAILAASASPQACDETCHSLQIVLAGRSSDFAQLKGAAESPGMWKGKVGLANLDCDVTDHNVRKDDANTGVEYSCTNFGDGTGVPKAESQRLFDRMFAALRYLEPNWKWSRDSDSPGFDLYAGPPGRYVVKVYIVPLLDDKSSTGFDVFAPPLDRLGDHTLKPYSP